MEKLLALLALIHSAVVPGVESIRSWDDSGIATVYHTPSDLNTWRGGTLACLWNKPIKDLPDEEHFCAHRHYRCGQVLLVHNPKTNLSTYCIVLDRGPFGALLPDGKWVIKIRRSDPGKWRGILDMSPGTAKAIGAKGWDYVRIKRVPERMLRRLAQEVESPGTDDPPPPLLPILLSPG